MRLWPVASGVAWRTLKNVFTNPSLLFPSLIFPLFFFTAFAGGLSQVSNVPGFDFEPGYTAFQFCFVLVQSAAFGGVFTGFGIARDFENGFARRLLLAAPNRTGIILGYAISALVRWTLTATVLTVVALIAGMNVFGGPGRRLRHVRARAADQRGRPALGGRRGDAVPHDAGGAGDADARLPGALLRARVRAARPADGWIETVATVNPLTYVLEAVRSMLAGDEVHVALAFGLALCLVALFAAWSLRRAAQGRSRRIAAVRSPAARVPSRRASCDQSAVRGRSARPRRRRLPRVGAPCALGRRRARRRRARAARGRRRRLGGRAGGRAGRRLPLRARRTGLVARSLLALAAGGRARAVADPRHRAASRSPSRPGAAARGARPLRAARRHLLAPRGRSTGSCRALPSCASSA